MSSAVTPPIADHGLFFFQGCVILCGRPTVTVPNPWCSMLKIIKFEAAWCQPCKQMKPVLEKLAGEFPTVEITALDIERDPTGLAARCGVQTVPTLVVLIDDQPAAKLIGAQSEGTLRRWLAEQLRSAEM